MNTKEISPEAFARAVEYVKKAECRSFATLSSIANMLGVRKFDVMAYLEQNPRLVVATEHVEYKTVVVPTRNIFNEKIMGHHEESRVSKRHGLCVDAAYVRVEDNPYNSEWLEKTIREFAKTVWVSEFNNYGQIVGHFLEEDVPDTGGPKADNRKNTWLWRNTRKKLEAVTAEGATREKTFCYGGFGDARAIRKPYAIDAEGVRLLERSGWTVIGKWFD